MFMKLKQRFFSAAPPDLSEHQQKETIAFLEKGYPGIRK